MIEVLKAWYEKHFSDPQAVILAFLIVLGTVVILIWGNILAPILAALVIAYVLEGLVRKINRFGIPRLVAVITSFSVFLAIVFVILLGLVPLLSKQLTQLFREIPRMLNDIQQLLESLPEKYPLLPQWNVDDVMLGVQEQLVTVGQKMLTQSLASVADIFTWIVFLIVVPLLVFFLLMDKGKILNWLRRFLPDEHGLSYTVWKEVDIKMGEYIRGKLLEVLIVGCATYIPLAFMGLNYAATLSFFVGVSVIIPYVGAIAVTIPVALIAWFQWGASADFVYLMIAYLVVQFLDANIVVPLLFSEVVNMHPAAIIMAILVFGGLWGVWGVFFAIPLATLIQAVINAWPSMQPSRDSFPDTSA